jgi:16S rRNA (guanine527-N7)-methyltransferase
VDSKAKRLPPGHPSPPKAAVTPPRRIPSRQVTLAFRERGFLLDPEQERKFSTFLEGILRWNRSVRLTGLRGSGPILKSLLLESADFLHLWDPPPSSIAVDAGSGAGIPGIPLKILRPRLSLLLVEANQRKAAFLKEMVRQLGLEGVEVLCARVEGLSESEGHRGRYHAVFSRGAGPLGRVLPWVWPLLREGGFFLIRQGRGYLEETEAAICQWERLGVRVVGERGLKGGRLLSLQKDVSRETPSGVG